MDVSEFDYVLLGERIAQVPIAPRDAARLLVDGGDDSPVHRHVSDLPDILRPGDLLVINETKVLPARLRLRRSSGGAAEVLLLEPLDAQRQRWEALVRPGKKLKVGERLQTVGDNAVELVEIGPRTPAGDTFEVRLLAPTADLDADTLLDGYGEMPLPPYITERLTDADRYQTVYAEPPGSAAAPTAGLHFTPALLDRLTDVGIGQARVELVIGLDTFRPIDTDNPLDHVIHTERFRVPDSTIEACHTTRRAGGRVVAVGTTSTRALESAMTFGMNEGRTDIFIHRGYEWKIVDMLLTNFHMPKTTLLMMIDAFVGPRWRSLYQIALDNQYRFLSFGDAMLLTRNPGDL